MSSSPAPVVRRRGKTPPTPNLQEDNHRHRDRVRDDDDDSATTTTVQGGGAPNVQQRRSSQDGQQQQQQSSRRSSMDNNSNNNITTEVLAGQTSWVEDEALVILTQTL